MNKVYEQNNPFGFILKKKTFYRTQKKVSFFDSYFYFFIFFFHAYGSKSNEITDRYN